MEDIIYDVEHYFGGEGRMAIAEVGLEFDDMVVAVVVVRQWAKREQRRNIAFEAIMAQDQLHPIYLVTPSTVFATIGEVENQILPFFDKLQIVPLVSAKLKYDKILVADEPEKVTNNLPAAKVGMLGQVLVGIDLQRLAPVRPETAILDRSYTHVLPTDIDFDLR